jgi:SlyX protein
MSEERITNLEIKFTHQDDLVDQLNKIVTSQQMIIEQLQKDVLDLKLLFADRDVAGNRTLKDDIPPHY